MEFSDFVPPLAESETELAPERVEALRANWSAELKRDLDKLGLGKKAA